MIDGVRIKLLTVNVDERGFLMEILRQDDDIFERFGQVYISLNYPGVIRAWHYHQKQEDFICAVKGMIKLALYDPRPDSTTKGRVEEYFLGEQNPLLMRIPMQVIHGYKTIGFEPALIVNIPTQHYDRAQPDEYRLPWDTKDIPYDWALKNR